MKKLLKKLSCLLLIVPSLVLFSAAPFHEGSMRRTCRQLLLQEMVRERLEESGYSPSTTLVEGSTLDPLSLLIKEIGAIKGVRFNEEELERAKEKVRILFSSEDMPSNESQSSGFIVFELSLRLLGAISLDEIEGELDHFFDDEEDEEYEDQGVNVVTLKEGEALPPEPLNTYGSLGEEDEEIEDPFLSPVDPADDLNALCTHYAELPLADWERQTIAYIVSNMAEKNVFQLLMEKKDMERKGKQVNHVHPLRFIGHVFSDTRLKRAMKTIKKSSFKWDGFVNGFAGRMREEGARNNLVRFVPGFAEHVGVNPDDIMPFIQRGDCESLLRFLTSGS